MQSLSCRLPIFRSAILGSELLSFLSRPRTLSEIAEHLNMPLERAEKLVIEEVESGRVLLSPVSQTDIKRTTFGQQSNWKATLKFSGATATSATREMKLPKTKFHKVGSRMEFGGSLPKLQARGPAVIMKSQKQPTVSELLGEKPGRMPSQNRMSSSDQAGLLEAIEKSPKPLMELRAQFHVTRETLDRMVGKGTLSYVWGPRGVGLSFAITEKGRQQLSQFRAAVLEIRKLSGKKLISAKAAAPL